MIADIWAEEAPKLMQVGRLFKGFVEHTKRVSPTCLVHFERNRYNVLESFANRPVSLRVYPDRMVVVAEGLSVCEHHRIINRSHDRPGRTVYDWRHYLASSSASPELYVMVHPLPNCLRPSDPCKSTFPRSWAETGRWPRSWPSRFTMMSRLS